MVELLVFKTLAATEYTLRANNPFQASVEVTRTSVIYPNSVNGKANNVPEELEKPT